MHRLKISLLSLYTLLIAYVTLSSDSSSDSVVPDLNTFGISNLDKLAHTGAYALFYILAVTGFGMKRLKSIRAILLIYGMILEILQTWVPQREPSLEDFLANLLGVILGSLVMFVLDKLPKNRFTLALLPNSDKS
ncbi:VanZ family protein [Vibrio ziniensis]|uniref:VanZ-like domain-containing protein n=1 Tax=Vibrio ziniensis TaxID=2711221 RepID=A0A6G7CMN4_9VIBR|nr:VanZ family protein [Vibrio ziniensis]QIH43308.1 hypothetical protein G5S32_14980 [Vibrio ziniensis]